MAATDIYLRCFVEDRRDLRSIEVLAPTYYENTPTFRAVIKATASDGVGIEAYDLTSKVVKILGRRIPQGAGLISQQMLRASQKTVSPQGFAGVLGGQVTFRQTAWLDLESAWEETMTLDSPATLGTAYWTASQTDLQRVGLYLVEVRETNTAETVQLVLGQFVLPIALAGESGTLGIYGGGIGLYF